MRIESRAPTRIDLAGGTLDIWPLYLFHEGAVTVNCAITRYASCVIETSARSRRITLISRDTRRRESFPSLDALADARRYELPLLAHLVRFFRPNTGLTLVTDSEAPAGAGIGGSSAMAVALCAALDCLTGEADSALANLKVAIELRSENRYHARNDEDFAFLQEDPQFTELLYPEKDGTAG